MIPYGEEIFVKDRWEALSPVPGAKQVDGVDCQHTSGTAYSSNILPKQSDVKITGAVKEYGSKAASGNTVTRVFCGECGSPLAHKSKAFGDAMAVQTGNLPDFRKVPYGAELFVKDRWTGLQPIPEADQVQIM
nr:uncharacterized protein CI109_003331 [Kwoniella shandongensis]KAA5528431.1 hypothetical protein CI109_003331 [Kwoniella shandongensis]